MSGIGGSVVSALTSLYSQSKSQQAQQQENEKNRQFNALEAQKNRDFQEQQSNKQYQRQLELWNKNNEYNSPSAQMSRLSAAGINPALAYSNGTGITAATMADAPSAGSGSAASSSASNIGDYSMFSGAMQNLANNMMQARLLEAQTNNLNTKTEGEKIDNSYKEFYHTRNLSLLDGKINLTLAQEVTEKATAIQIANQNDLLKEDIVKARAYNAVYSSVDGIAAMQELLSNEADMSNIQSKRYAEYFQAQLDSLVSGRLAADAQAFYHNKLGEDVEKEIAAKMKTYIGMGADERAKLNARELGFWCASYMLSHQANVANAQGYQESIPYWIYKEGVSFLTTAVESYANVKGAKRPASKTTHFHTHEGSNAPITINRY